MTNSTRIKLGAQAIAAAQPLPLGDSLVAYFEKHQPVGGFMTSLLANDLIQTVGRADERNTAALRFYCAWLYNHAPSRATGSWGSYEAVRDWAPGSG